MTDGTPERDIPALALSLLTLVPGGMGGSETYARELTKQLAGSASTRLTVFVPSPARGFAPTSVERVIELPAARSVIGRLRVTAALIRRTPELRRAMAGAEVVHFPFTVPLPLPTHGQATVQSLLDVQHLDLPHMFSRAELAYRKMFYEGAAKRADAVITISHFAKSRMVELLGIDPTRIHVAHLGVDGSQFTPNLGARDGFILYPARSWPHKNHRRLIAAMEIVRRENRDLRLVLTGGGLDTLGKLPEWVDRLGLVSAEELRDLYRRASAMVFPSLYEGFGMPPLEAMASGCPVAAANVGSIPEVVGDAAVLFDPLDVEAMAQAIDEVLHRPRPAQTGITQAHKFTWERCLAEHAAAYTAARERVR